MKYLLILLAFIPLSGCCQGGGIGYWNDQTECLANGLDVAFLVDNTGSMGGAIDNLKSNLAVYLNAIEEVSGGKYRLSLGAVNNPPTLTPIVNFSTQNRLAFESGMNSLTASGGGDEAEPWEVAYDATLGGSLGAWSENAEKLIIVITDAPAKTPANIPNIAYTSTVLGARALCIHVGNSPVAQANLMQMASLTNGAYGSINQDGSGIAQGIINLIENLCENK